MSESILAYISTVTNCYTSNNLCKEFLQNGHHLHLQIVEMDSKYKIFLWTGNPQITGLNPTIYILNFMPVSPQPHFSIFLLITAHPKQDFFMFKQFLRPIMNITFLTQALSQLQLKFHYNMDTMLVSKGILFKGALDK